MANYSVSHLIAAVKDKGFRFIMVSVVNVIVGQGLLFLTVSVLDWHPLLGNLTSVSISAVPAYILTRAWVWGKSGKNHLTKEVLPFWGMALAGLAISMVAVGLVAGREPKILVNLAQLASFGVLWVIKFFILDALMFGTHHHVPEDEPTDGAAVT